MTAYLGASITFVIGAILLTPFGYSFWQMSFRDAAIMTANKQRIEAAMSSRLTEGFLHLQHGPDGRPTGFSAIQSSAYVSPAFLNGVGEAWTLIHRRSIGIIGLCAVVALFGCLAVSCFMPTRNLNASVVHDGNKVILQWHEK